MKREVLTELTKKCFDPEIVNSSINNIKVKIVSNKLLNLFKQFKDRKFLFIEPGGNFGDTLIYLGAHKLANLSHVKFESLNYQQFIRLDLSNNDIIYIHGSGGFVPWWSGRPIKIFRKAISFSKNIVILGPTTFSTDKDFLKKTLIQDIKNGKTRNFYIFAREHVSYNILKELLPSKYNIYLDHDTALNLCSEDFLLTKGKGNFTLYSIREDKESLNVITPDFFSICLDPIRFCYSFEHWLMLHAQAKNIITNRLHSAILGSILNIPTTLLPNSYHKNHSVWEFSLSKRGVKWISTISQKKISCIINSIHPLKKALRTSYFINFLQLLYGVRYRI